MDHLSEFDPILTGTIPLGIDIESSDLDIICHVPEFQLFTKCIVTAFAQHEGFKTREKQLHGIDSLICRFYIENILIEIVGQNVPVYQQLAYKHMVVESKILEHFGISFKTEIIALKKSGLKTEPAFAILLGLEGDPYHSLLEYTLPDENG
jgi:hypothetical protein